MGYKPKVSIIMGIYNCEDTLGKSIDSIIEQTYTNWELIMCDDASIDGTLNIAEEYAIKYPEKIIVLKNDRNITLAPTLNKCINYVSGNYIARQDGDDFSNKNRLEKQVEFLENNKEYALVGTSMISFDKNRNKGEYRLKKTPTIDDLITHCTTFAHATILIKTDVMKKLNGYNEDANLNQLEDYELWSRFFKLGFKGYNLSESLYYVREDDEAYKRKDTSRRLRAIRLRFRTNKMLNVKKIKYIYILKDVLALSIPNFIFRIYYKARLKK